MDIIDYGDSCHVNEYGSNYDGVRSNFQCAVQRQESYNRRLKTTYHGGCMDCTKREVYGDRYCDGCQYKIPNWELPDLSGSDRDLDWELRKMKMEMQRDNEEVLHAMRRPVRPPKHIEGFSDMVRDTNAFWMKAFSNFGNVLAREGKKIYTEIVKWFTT